MNKHRLIKLFFLFVFPGLIFSSFAQWETVSPGFDYQKFVASGATNVFVMRMALDNPRYRAVDSCVSQGQLSKFGLQYGGREVVSSMVKRNDDTILYWGQRRQIIAAINGDYWERKSYPSGPYTGRPQGGQIVSGWFARRFPEFTGGSGFFYTISGIPHIGGDVRNGATADCHQRVIFADSSPAYLTGINVERGANDLMLYTPQWGPSTQTDDSGVEVLVSVDSPNFPLNYGEPQNSCNGKIVEIRYNKGNTFIPFDHIVLSGTGSHAATLRNKCSSGQSLNLQMFIRDYGFPSNIRIPSHPPQDWTGAFAGIGCDREILIDSQLANPPKSDTTKRARTGVAFNKTHVFFVVVEETSQKGASGMTFGEMAQFCKDTLSATHACSVDGGGSSVLWIRGKGIVNKPSDGGERATCNGLFMISIQDKQQSSSFKPGAAVLTKSPADIRLGPGTNYSPIANIPQSEKGTIVNHNLNGVLATGESWWNAQFGAASGWCSETALQSLPD